MTRATSQASRLPDRLLDRVLKYSAGHLRDDTVILSVMRTREAERDLASVPTADPGAE